jgi:hypothetical protein
MCVICIDLAGLPRQMSEVSAECTKLKCRSGRFGPDARCSRNERLSPTAAVLDIEEFVFRVVAILHSCIPNSNIVTGARYLCMLHSSRTMQLRMVTSTHSLLLAQLLAERNNKLLLSPFWNVITIYLWRLPLD